jgi:hypothetical protein
MTDAEMAEMDAFVADLGYRNEVRAAMLAHIGRINILSISGGRIEWLDDFTVKLPISNGYAVEVEYDRGWDLYTVRRTFTRRPKWTVDNPNPEPVRKVKGEVTMVYAEDLGETAWRAHAFRSYEFGE